MNPTDGNWFEDESFWARTFAFMFPDASFVAAAENVPKIVALTGISTGRVLDLACGPGRYAVPFAQAGFAVTGVDRTPFLLQKARERAAAVGGANVEWVEQDMREFVRPAAFDLALNTYTSFGYFEDAAENRRVLDNVLASLKPGGAFLLELLGKEVLAARYQRTRSEALPDGRLMIHRVSIVDDWSRVDAEWILLEGDQAKRMHLRHWLYSGRELRSLLEEAGFAEAKLYGTLNGTPYDPNADRLIAVARKASA
jgi:SAM-dependent methyltransferase